MNWQYLMYHHTAGPKTQTVEQIRNYHVNGKGWSDIGYHFLVDYKGNIHEGRPLTRRGAHEEKYNGTAIGIAAIGNFEEEKMPPEQERAIIELSRKLMKQYNISPQNLLLHRDVDATACPGKHFPAERIRFQLRLKDSDPVDEAIAWLKEQGITSSPEYWRRKVKEVKYLDQLFINIAKKWRK